MARLLIVDDHAIFRYGLRSILEQEPGVRVVAEAADAAEAMRAVETHRPDLVLLDLKLDSGAEVGGLDLCRRLTQAFPEVGVLVLTTFLSDRLVVEAIRHGAKGYVLKDVDVASLVRSIDAVRRGESAFDSHAAAVVVRSLSGESEPGQKAVLTDRELEVVRLLARGLSNREIGATLFISESTVKFHVHNIMSRLQVTRRTEVVYRAGQLGLV
ncbi:MAG: response regulator [Propionibacteriales bacterium]|nr:response regulator [Propionibacteriales bacterium]